MIGCQGKMKRIAYRICRHDAVLNVGSYNLADLLFNRHLSDVSNESECSFSVWEIRMRQLINYGPADDRFISASHLIPPQARPVVLCRRNQVGPLIEVRADHRCLYINSLSHAYGLNA